MPGQRPRDAANTVWASITTNAMAMAVVSLGRLFYCNIAIRTCLKTMFNMGLEGITGGA